MKGVITTNRRDADWASREKASRRCEEAAWTPERRRQFLFEVAWNEWHGDGQLNRCGIQAHASEMIGAIENLGQAQ